VSTLRRLPVLVALLAAGCGGSPGPESAPPSTSAPAETAAGTEPSTAPQQQPPPPPKPKPQALPGLPAYTAGYTKWTRLNAKPIPPRESGDAHLGTKQVFASKKRAPSGRFPYGTIVVKEAQRPGKDFIGLIAVMRKERGADPAHNDWRFVEWTREGADERFTLTARDSICWSCHAGAQQTDYLWIYTLGLAR
jgi:Cytochrome P460